MSDDSFDLLQPQRCQPLWKTILQGIELHRPVVRPPSIHNP
jgi:hypothetical protein